MFSSSPTFIFKTPTIFYTTYMSKSTCMWIYLGYVYQYLPKTGFNLHGISNDVTMDCFDNLSE